MKIWIRSVAGRSSCKLWWKICAGLASSGPRGRIAAGRLVRTRKASGTGFISRRGRSCAIAGMIYPCTCSRKDVAQAAGAPNDLDDEPVYSGRCRPWLRRGRSASPSRDSRGGRLHMGCANPRRLSLRGLCRTPSQRRELAVSGSRWRGDLFHRSSSRAAADGGGARFRRLHRLAAR